MVIHHEHIPRADRVVRFDPQKRVADSSLGKAVETIIENLLTTEVASSNRMRVRSADHARQFRNAIEAIVCNFLVIQSIDPQRVLAIPRSNSAMRGRPRYRPEIYGSAFIDALDLMASPVASYIELVTAGFRFKGEEGKPSTYRATRSLLNVIDELDCGVSAITSSPLRECLVLKAVRDDEGNKPLMDYKDTIRTKALKKQIVAINEWLLEAPIFLNLEDAQHINARSDEFIDPSRRQLRRVFNNGSWYEGGRLFGGFWETMPRASRYRSLRIGSKKFPAGEPVANVDHGQLFPRLAYMVAMTPPPDGDLYDVFGDGLHRSGIKKIFNAMLFSQGGLKNWPRDTSQLLPGKRLSDVLQAIRDKHPALEKCFGTGIGHRLMFQESELLLEALSRLRSLGIVALPLHDSVLVAGSEAETAKTVLEAALPEMPEEFRARVTISYADDYIE